MVDGPRDAEERVEGEARVVVEVWGRDSDPRQLACRRVSVVRKADRRLVSSPGSGSCRGVGGGQFMLARMRNGLGS